MEINELLFNLQKYDNTLKGVRVDLAKMEGRKAEMLADIKNSEKAVSTTNSKIKDAGIEVAILEKDVDCIDAQIKKHGDKFLLIKNEKELAKYNAETDKLQKDKSAIEEKILEAMDKSEKYCSELKALQADLEKKRKLYDIELADLEKLIANQKEEVEKLMKHRNEFSRSIPVDKLAIYDKLFAAKHGQAVAVVSRKVCSGCRLSISDNTLNNAKMVQSLVFCPNCQRIIHLES